MLFGNARAESMLCTAITAHPIAATLNKTPKKCKNIVIIIINFFKYTFRYITPVTHNGHIQELDGENETPLENWNQMCKQSYHRTSVNLFLL